MKWKPVVTEGGSLPPELAKKLREFGFTGFEAAGYRTIEADSPPHYYLQGLAAAGVEGASMLDSALNRFGEVRVVRETGEREP